MSTITINVKDINIQTVMTILENLKAGLIEDIEVDNKTIKKRTQYQPKTNNIVKEGEQTQSKYVNAATYKKRLNS